MIYYLPVQWSPILSSGFSTSIRVECLRCHGESDVGEEKGRTLELKEALYMLTCQ